MRKLLMECIGTLFLMMAVAFSGNNPIAVGLMLAVMVYSGGHLSGGHFNPAVSLAAWMRGKLGVADMVQYMVAQLVGACLGWLVHSYLMGGSTAPMPTEHPLMHGVVAEALLAFALVTVVLNMMSSRSAGNPVGGLAIGFTLSAALYTGAGVSGGAFNPAVGLGPQVMEAITGGGFDANTLALYGVGPLVGGAVAALVYKFLND
ncbi:MAG: aquaporin family protein [Acidobacteria bacterium]|nr:aquaporin family protein [Acidobacteriota bacterium]MCY3930361.1 aquaporin family protein [Acidobacteriota bacterium]